MISIFSSYNLDVFPTGVSYAAHSNEYNILNALKYPRFPLLILHKGLQILLWASSKLDNS
jgi:hypothetical protein